MNKKKILFSCKRIIYFDERSYIYVSSNEYIADFQGFQVQDPARSLARIRIRPWKGSENTLFITFHYFVHYVGMQIHRNYLNQDRWEIAIRFFDLFFIS